MKKIIFYLFLGLITISCQKEDSTEEEVKKNEFVGTTWVNNTSSSYTITYKFVTETDVKETFDFSFLDPSVEYGTYVITENATGMKATVKIDGDEHKMEIISYGIMKVTFAQGGVKEFTRVDN
jgi:hypothetical protein